MEIKSSTLFILALIFLIGSWVFIIFVYEQGFAGVVVGGLLFFLFGILPCLLFVLLGIIQLVKERKKINR